MASFEFVAARDIDIGDGAPHVGMEIPGPGGTTWRVVRIETTTEALFGGGETAAHLRAVCEIIDGGSLSARERLDQSRPALGRPQ